VDEGLDSGPIILQEAVPVLAGDTEESLAQRILEVEHRLYPEAVRRLVLGKVERTGRRVQILLQEGLE
jgi:phosphoribosylglycinamide formyltransferase-1